jgi:hypothetical protein
MNGMTLDTMPEILTAKDISEYLGICYNSALTLIKYHITHIKIGTTYRVTKTHFKEFLDKDTSVEFQLKG